MYNDTQIVKRSVLSRLIEHLEEKEISILLGARQVGKTTLMRELQIHLISKKKIAEDQIHSFNLDIFTDREIFLSQDNFINFLRERSADKFIYVFIDEVQRIENAGLFIKGVYDLGLPVKMILSGSSSLEIKDKISEPLTGRKKIFLITTLSFEEFVLARENKLNILKNTILRSEEKHRLQQYLNEYIVYGAYPRVALERDAEKKKELLGEIYSSYIEKDIAGFLKIKEPQIFSNLVKLLAFQNGQLCNTNSIAKNLNINQRTVEKYLYYLEQTYVIQKLAPFFSNPKKELVKMAKIYFSDTGIVNLLLGDFSNLETRKDKGEPLENFALNTLKEKMEIADRINFWRTKSGVEVDFVIRKGAITFLFEIKATLPDEKELRGLRLFNEVYKVENSFVVYKKETLKKINNKNIHEVPAVKLCLLKI